MIWGDCEMCGKKGTFLDEMGWVCSTKCQMKIYKKFDKETCDCCEGLVGT